MIGLVSRNPKVMYTETKRRPQTARLYRFFSNCFEKPGFHIVTLIAACWATASCTAASASFAYARNAVAVVTVTAALAVAVALSSEEASLMQPGT